MVSRYFPGERRHRVLALMAALLMVLSATVVQSAAQADDDLKDKQKKVKKQVNQAEQDLDSSSAALRKATKRLKSAKTELSEARQELASTRGKLANARAKDRLMQAKLATAKQKLATAKQKLAAGQRRVRSQKAEVGEMMAATYEQGPAQLENLSALLEARELSEVTLMRSATQASVEEQNGVLAGLEAAEVLLATRKSNIAEQKQIVAEQRQAAAENLAEKRRLEAQAVQDRNSVRTLVGKRGSARKAAARVRARDRKALRELEAQQREIQQELKERAARRARKRGQSAGGAPSNPGGFLSYPTTSTRVTSPYGYRTHPIYGYYSLHDGTDFGVGCGQPLFAAADGTVVNRYWSDAYGNRLVIDHGYQRGVSLASIYNHATSYTVGAGEHVDRGEVIGYVGSTGWSTGCHLHFTVMANGNTVDPMNWL